MIKSDSATVIGIGASIGTALYLLPQLFKIIKTKKSEDISIWMLVVLFTGVSLWIAYGFLKKDWIIIISNCVSLLINIAIVTLALRYQNKNNH